MSVHAPRGSGPDGLPGIELELKFDLSPRDVRKLCHTPWLKALQEGNVRRQSLRALYFDTPAFDLSARRVSLRVRKESHAYVQCLKSNTASDQNGFSRHEREWRVKRAQLNPDLLKSDKEIMETLAGIDISALRAVFETDVTRQGRILVCADGTRLKCEIDRGVIVAGDAKASVYEMELEFVSGEIASLYDIARKITQSVPARLSLRSKSCRGFSLASGAVAHWERARHPKPHRDATNDEVLRTSLQTGLRQVLANAPCVLSRSHQEGVHQMRVALRRMRSTLSLYQKAQKSEGDAAAHKAGQLVAMIRESGAALSDARDWDVFIGTTLSAVRFSDGASPGVAVLRRRAEILRDAAYARAQAHLGTTDYASLLVELAAWSTLGSSAEDKKDEAGVEAKGRAELAKSSAPAVNFARHELIRHHARLMKRGRGLKKMSPGERHRLRITVKKARYTSELFASLFDVDKGHPYLKALGKFQDILGHLNDRMVAERLLEQIGAVSAKANGKKNRTKDKNFWRAMGEVSGWYGQRQISLEQDLLSAWKTFSRCAPFWTT